MANRLAGASSPYLLQHKDNPVDWYPWGEEAFARAVAEDKPVFLSVGYSSCHWCHVMAHESFESAVVASALNESFICVKVDREERPDIDEAYMTAVQLSSGRGGWPMTVFLTPDKKPFFAGTYFPREDRGQHPGFVTICNKIADLWKTKRTEIESNAAEFAEGLSEAIVRQAPPADAAFDEEFLAAGVKALASQFDNENGGFGGAPKFPPHTSIEFLLEYGQRDTAPIELREVAFAMAFATLEKIALGGIHDHVGGGFHRYSTDEKWHLPHFEKMLYDNALLVGNFATARALCHALGHPLEDLFGRSVAGINRWIAREMMLKCGYASAIDADSEGEEGKFYVWTAAEIEEALGERAETFMKAFGVLPEGNFCDEATGELTGANVLHATGHFGGQFDAELEILLGVRSKRTRPQTDEKVLLGWSGLLIANLSYAGDYHFTHREAVEILDTLGESDDLPHQIVNGTPIGEGFLDDYAGFAWGLFMLADVRQAIEESDWRKDGGYVIDTRYGPGELRDQALRLTKRMIELFWDEAEGGFFGTSTRHEQLFGRSKPVFDSPTPSGNSLALRCLIVAGELERAQKCMQAFLGWMDKAPQATEGLYTAAMNLVGMVTTPVVAVAPASTLGAEVPSVVVRMEPREIQAKADGIGRGEVVISIPEGYHVNTNQPPARWLVPTAIVAQPLTTTFSFPATATEDYRGEVRIGFEVKLPSGSSGEDFEMRVSYQACTESECLAPEERVLNGVLLR